jgi:hypothetical protein
MRLFPRDAREVCRLIPVAATVGRKPRETLWVQLRLTAVPPEKVAVVIESYDGLEMRQARTLYAGLSIAAIRVFNDTVDALKREGFRGLKPIQPAGGFDAYEAALRANTLLSEHTRATSN